MPCVQLCEPVHRTSHAHELPHETSRHELGPEQVTSHGPAPHWTPRHEPLPLHVIVHDAPAVQVTPLRHALSVLHWMSQWKPVGQLTWLWQNPASCEQSIVQVFWVRLHHVQPLGH
jgi:hypothetical protein